MKLSYYDGYNIRIGNKIYPVPNYVRNCSSNSFYTVNGRYYINGYKVTKNGEFKRTIPAILHHIFH